MKSLCLCFHFPLNKSMLPLIGLNCKMQLIYQKIVNHVCSAKKSLILNFNCPDTRQSSDLSSCPALVTWGLCVTGGCSPRTERRDGETILTIGTGTIPPIRGQAHQTMELRSCSTSIWEIIIQI